MIDPERKKLDEIKNLEIRRMWSTRLAYEVFMDEQQRAKSEVAIPLGHVMELALKLEKFVQEASLQKKPKGKVLL